MSTARPDRKWRFNNNDVSNLPKCGGGASTLDTTSILVLSRFQGRRNRMADVIFDPIGTAICDRLSSRSRLLP